MEFQPSMLSHGTVIPWPGPIKGRNGPNSIEHGTDLYFRRINTERSYDPTTEIEPRVHSRCLDCWKWLTTRPTIDFSKSPLSARPNIHWIPSKLNAIQPPVMRLSGRKARLETKIYQWGVSVCGFWWGIFELEGWRCQEVVGTEIVVVTDSSPAQTFYPLVYIHELGARPSIYCIQARPRAFHVHVKFVSPDFVLTSVWKNTSSRRC